MIGVDSAFIRSGRLKVSVATPSSMVSSSSAGRPFFLLSYIHWPASLRDLFLMIASASVMVRSINSTGRNVVDHPATIPQPRRPHPAHHPAGAHIAGSADEVANVLDRRGGTLSRLMARTLTAALSAPVLYYAGR
jgi:hypothetical protein